MITALVFSLTLMRDESHGQIDLAACFLDVGSSSIGVAQGTTIRVVRPLKGNVSWVQTVERQVGFYLTVL